MVKEYEEEGDKGIGHEQEEYIEQVLFEIEGKPLIIAGICVK